MYQLTPRMQQNFRQYLEKYHDLFDGGRCSGWELEELIYKSIQSDNTAGHHATWKKGFLFFAMSRLCYIKRALRKSYGNLRGELSILNFWKISPTSYLLYNISAVIRQ